MVIAQYKALAVSASGIAIACGIPFRVLQPDTTCKLMQSASLQACLQIPHQRGVNHQCRVPAGCSARKQGLQCMRLLQELIASMCRHAGSGNKRVCSRLARLGEGLRLLSSRLCSLAVLQSRPGYGHGSSLVGGYTAAAACQGS